MEFSETDLEKLATSPEELAYWKQKLKEEEEGLARLKTLEAAKVKITQLSEKTKEEIIQAENTLTERLLAWAVMGRPRKNVCDLKQKMTGLQDLILDCEKALPLIEKEFTICRKRQIHGRNIRSRIAEKAKNQEKNG